LCYELRTMRGDDPPQHLRHRGFQHRQQLIASMCVEPWMTEVWHVPRTEDKPQSVRAGCRSQASTRRCPARRPADTVGGGLVPRSGHRSLRRYVLGGLARAAGLYSTTPRYDGCFELVAGAGFEPATFSFMSLAFVLGAMTFGNNLAEKIGLPADKNIRIWPIRCAFTGPNRYPDPDVTSCTPLAVLRSMVRSH